MFRNRNSRGGKRPSPHSSQSNLLQSNSLQSWRKTTWAEYLFILGGLGIAAAASGAALILGTGFQFIGPLWIAGITWTVVAQTAHVPVAGFPPRRLVRLRPLRVSGQRGVDRLEHRERFLCVDAGRRRARAADAGRLPSP